MRFVLDHDVDARVRRILLKAGHDCWTVGEARLATADDDDVAVYAHDKGACVITHDGEATARRKQNLYGQLIRLDCEHPDAVEVVGERLGEIVEKLEAHAELVLRVTRTAVRVEAPHWLRDT